LQVLKTKSFSRFARKEGLEDALLVAAIAAIERGLMDADMGGGLIKQRVARKGGGKRGGFRTLLAYQQGKKAVFLFGFAKNAQENISPEDVRDLKEYGAILLALKSEDIARMTQDGALQEVDYD